MPRRSRGLKLKPPRPGHPNYTIRGTYLKIRVSRSAGTPDAKLAQKILAKIERDIERGAYTDGPVKTFADAVRSYLYADGDGRFLRRLTLHFGETMPLAKVDQAAVDEAAAKLYPHASPATRNRQVYCPVSAVLQHAGIKTGLKRPKGGQGKARTTWLREEQAFALLASAGALQPRFGALLRFLLYTGCRLSEGLRLRWEDVELQHAQALIRITKNGEPRKVHLTVEMVAQLANMEAKTGRVFGYNKDGAIYQMFRAAAFKAGLDIDERVAFHVLRHTFGAWGRRYGKLDTSGLVATGAWKSEKAARVYEHVDVDEAAKVAEMFPTEKRA